MKKYFLNYLTILMVAFVSVGFIACSSDDDDNHKNKVSLVGTWKYSFSTGYVIKKFNANLTGYSQEYDTQDGGWHKKHEFTYTYDENQNKLYLVESDGENVIYEVRELSAAKLILVEIYKGHYESEIEYYERQ